MYAQKLKELNVTYYTDDIFVIVEHPMLETGFPLCECCFQDAMDDEELLAELILDHLRQVQAQLREVLYV